MKPREKDLRHVATSSIIQAAYDYARLGLRVVPVHARSKRPRQRDWGGKATSKLKVIARWPAPWGDGNLGLATSSRLIALDVDPGHGGTRSLQQLIAKHGPLPPTAEARTGSGGSHYLFRVGGRRRIGNRTDLRPGLDIRAEGGCIVVAPSVHPETGREYAWVSPPSYGIAEAPGWLVRLLAEGERRPRPGPNSPRRAPLGGRRTGDAGRLLGEMIAKFPIPRYGTRHDLMTRAVGSLMGREFGDDLVTEVLTSWWQHFHEGGRTRTGEAEAARELAACIASTRRSTRFEPARGGEWHRDRCRRIRLDARQKKLLRAPLPAGEEGAGPRAAGKSPEKGEPPPHCKSVTRIGVRLCNSPDEEAYVEALIVHVTHKRVDLGEGAISMIDDQVRQIAAERRGPGWRAWDNKQMARLKRKYIGSPEAVASRFELLRMVRRGERGSGSAPGTPSEYEATGIEGLLKSAAVCPTGRRCA